jgi:hypothetical protein
MEDGENEKRSVEEDEMTLDDRRHPREMDEM